ncbi:MAG: metallophosphoesterase [Caldilineaceae bacterium]
MSKLFVVGDIHGQYTKLVSLLQSKRLVDRQLRWIGGNASLCFTGDFVDRGPDGIGCVELIMRLQREAALAGGQIVALLGNHEVMLLAAHRFENELFDCIASTFWELWRHNGGIGTDFERLTEEHLAWLSNLPAMYVHDDYLFMHSDTIRYAEYGESLEEINYRISTVLHSDLAWAWVQLLCAVGAREDFVNRSNDGVFKAQAMLEQYGGCQIVHGHTPISCVTKLAAGRVMAPFIYADGLCINVDAGMYLGSEGFIYELSRNIPEVTPVPETSEEQFVLELPETFTIQFPEPIFTR